MTAPHPALIQLVVSGEAGPIEDEGTFLQSVHEHRMTAPVLTAYQRQALRLSPASATTLGIWDLAERRQHLLFWKAIQEVQDRLAPTGAEVAVLKGVATEARWYGEIGQRVSTDVDLLLAPDALDGAAKLVATIDKRRGVSSAIDSLVRQRLLQHVDLHVGPVHVDLHFDPLKIGIPTHQLDEVWDSTQLFPTPHGMIRVLRPEIELVLLLLHLNKDSFAFLGSYLDIRQIVARAALDWDYVRSFVAGEGLEVPVFKSLAAVTELLGLDLDVPRTHGVRAWCWERLWGRATRPGGHDSRMRAPTAQRFLAFHASGRTRATVREVRRQLLPARQLLEVAGRLEPGRSYVRYLSVDRFRRRSRSASPDGTVFPTDVVDYDANVGG